MKNPELLYNLKIRHRRLKKTKGYEKFMAPKMMLVCQGDIYVVENKIR